MSKVNINDVKELLTQINSKCMPKTQYEIDINESQNNLSLWYKSDCNNTKIKFYTQKANTNMSIDELYCLLLGIDWSIS